MPAQRQNSTLRRFRSTSHHCCLRSLGMCSCPVPDPCKTLGGGLGGPAIRCRALPVCIESELSAEPRSSTRCSRSRGCEREAEVSCHAAAWDNSRHWLQPAPPLRWGVPYSFATRADQRFVQCCCWQTTGGHRVNGWLVAARQ